MKKYCFIFKLMLLFFFSSLCYANNNNIEAISLNQETPTTEQEVIVKIQACNLLNFSISVVSHTEPDTWFIDITGVPDDHPGFLFIESPGCSKNKIVDVSLGRLPAGNYHIGYLRIAGARTARGQGKDVLGRIIFTVIEADQGVPPKAYHETPAANSIQSGIGLVRGWACNANKVDISIDGGNKLRVPHGGTRGDTKQVCANDGFNGYGMVIAWGLLPAGEHRMQTFVDDIEIADVTFSVVKVDDGFLNREEVEYTLPDFPDSDQQVTIQWRDALQNFTIISNPEPIP